MEENINVRERGCLLEQGADTAEHREQKAGQWG